MDWLKWYADMASNPAFKAHAWHRVNEMAKDCPELFGELPRLLTEEMKRRAAVLPLNEPRCLGHGAGPTGHQLRADCVNCQRRLAPRAGVEVIEPPAEFPCPAHIPAKETT